MNDAITVVGVCAGVVRAVVASTDASVNGVVGICR